MANNTGIKHGGRQKGTADNPRRDI